MYMSILPVWIYVYHSCALNRGRSEEGASALELEWWMLVSHHVGAGNWPGANGRAEQSLRPQALPSSAADQGSVPSSHTKLPTTA